MKETFTKEEVIALLVKERQRAIDIAYVDYHKYTTKAKHGDQRLIWHYKELADTARLTGNAISGRTALNIDEPLVNCVKSDYPELK